MNILIGAGIVLAVLVLALVVLIYTAPGRVLAYALGRDRASAGLTRKVVELPGGSRYVYLEGGSGEPLMLLHGFGANKDNFVRAVRHLTPRYRVILPDHIGFGESSRPMDADYSPPAQAERLHALAQALGITRVHLGGSSMGGHIAMMYAVRYPGEVASLWLLDPGGVWSAPPSELRRVLDETGRNGLVAQSTEDFRKLVELVMAKPPYFPAPLLNYMAQERIANYALEQRIFQALFDHSIESHVKGLSVPTLIVWGDQDRVIHVDSAPILKALLPNSRAIIMRGIGHLPMLERPAESASDYLKFRASLAV
jgi:pimeloyl-ACP methyl ester carboxylesterase